MLTRMLKPAPRAKAKTWWNRNQAKGKRKREWTQFRMKKKAQQAPRLGLMGGMLALAGVATWLAMRSARKKAAKYPQSGQAPSRGHIRMSTHPAAQQRFG